MVIGQHDPRKCHEYLTRRFKAGGKGLPRILSVLTVSLLRTLFLGLRSCSVAWTPHMRGQRNTSRSQSLMRIAATRFLGVALLICSERTPPSRDLKPEIDFS